MLHSSGSFSRSLSHEGGPLRQQLYNRVRDCQPTLPWYNLGCLLRQPALECAVKLHEHETKRLFAERGIPIPPGDIASSPSGARRVAERLGVPVVVKAQVLTGGRGKAGGIRLARTLVEAEVAAQEILAMELKGLPVRRVLVEQAAEVQRELYLGMVVDRASARSVLVASSEGGVEIEAVARAAPAAIHRITLEPLLGLRGYQTLAMAKAIGLPRLQHSEFDRIARALCGVYQDSDARLAEINPLVVDSAGALIAVDGKVVLDENALFRHPELASLRDLEAEMAAEREAREAGLSYVKLDGNIGCMVNGAGLAMATMDVVQQFGGAPANFLDIGGGASPARVAVALRLMLSDPALRAVLFNIFGGITRCDEVAKGIVEVLTSVRPNVPLVARLVGTNEAEGRDILHASGLAIETAVGLTDAARKVVAAAEGAPPPRG